MFNQNACYTLYFVLFENIIFLRQSDKFSDTFEQRDDFTPGTRLLVKCR